MAVPSYTTDLQVSNDFESTYSAAEFTGWTGGRTQSLDSDYPIQGTQHVSAILATVSQGSIAVSITAPTWTSGWAFFMWGTFLAPAAIDTRANGGMVMMIGSATSAYRQYNVGGNDFGSYPYGGWQNFVADPQVLPTTTVGSPTTSYSYVGMGNKTISAVSKGSPQGIDVIRYGRGEVRIAGGETGDLANFADIALVNDANTARWGLFQQIPGGYRWKGLLYFGYGAATEFAGADQNIVVDNTLFVQPSFNRIELHNAASIISWTNVSISALGTVSRGQFEMIDNCSFTDDGGVFTDMDTFIYQSNASLTGRTFRGCNQVTQGGAEMDACVFESSTATYALNASVPNNVTNCIFKGNATALYLPSTVTGTITLSGDVFTNNTTDVYWAGTSGTLYINSPSVSQAKTSTAGGTIVVQNAVVLTIEANVSLVGAEVRIYDYNSTGGNLGTELDGIESNLSSNFVYGGSGGNVIWIQVLLDNYVEYGAEFTMPASDGTTKLTLEPDLND